MELIDKHILVTGADGFIGSHLVEALFAAGCRVRALAQYNSFNSWGWLDSLPRQCLDNIEVISGDIRDRGSVNRVMQDVDVVFHLAALIGIPYSYYSPESYVATNITGTLNILEEARRLGTSRVLVTSTSEVYGTAKYVPMDENHPYQGQSPYSATKIAADRMTESYYRSFDLPATIVRPFNTFGPRQSARAVIPTIISQLCNGNDEIKLGSLAPTRDMVYVKDTVRGFMEIAKCDATIGEEINIATQQEVSVGEIATALIGMIRPTARVVEDVIRLRPGKSEVERLMGSNEKIKILTGWKPDYSFEDGLLATVAWFSDEKNLRHYKANIYNL